MKKQMEEESEEYYLNEQMKAIQKELGDQEGKACKDSIFSRKNTECLECPRVLQRVNL